MSEEKEKLSEKKKEELTEEKRKLILAELARLIESEYFNRKGKELRLEYLRRYFRIYEKGEEPAYEHFYQEKDIKKHGRGSKEINNIVEKNLKRLKEDIENFYKYKENSSSIKLVFVECKSSKRKKKFCLDVVPTALPERKGSLGSIVIYNKKVKYRIPMQTFNSIVNIFSFVGYPFVVVIGLIGLADLWMISTSNKQDWSYLILAVICGIIVLGFLSLAIDYFRFQKYNFTSISAPARLFFLLFELPIHIIRYKSISKISFSQQFLETDIIDDKFYVIVTEYEAFCPICKSYGKNSKIKIDFDRKKHRFIGSCVQNPLEHKFSFDYVTLRGKRIVE